MSFQSVLSLSDDYTNIGDSHNGLVSTVLDLPLPGDPGGGPAEGLPPPRQKKGGEREKGTERGKRKRYKETKSP